MSTPQVQPGAIVAWWEGGALTFGVVASEEKQRLRMVLNRGKELRIKPSRIVVEVAAAGRPPGTGVEERRTAGERVAAVETRIREHADDIDVPLLWELSGAQAETDGKPCTVRDLAELALASSYGDAQAAVILALHAEGLHFARGDNTWQPRTAEAVEELRVQRARIRQREEETAKVFAALASASRDVPFQETGLELERRYLTALEQVAVFEDSASEPDLKTALTALRATDIRFDRPHAGAFELLRRVGRFTSDDENLQVIRYSLEPGFPAELLEEAERAAQAWDLRESGDRLDLTGLATFSIDSPQTKELDDLLSVEELAAGGVRVGIHIADPGAFLPLGDPLDREALARGLTRYMPDQKILMLPPRLAEQAASLMEGVERPALSFLVDVDAEGEVADYRIERSVVRSRKRLNYDEVDRTLREGGGACEAELLALHRVAECRQVARIRAGAVVIDAPEVEVLRGESGELRLQRFPAGAPGRRIVTEAMVLAGAVAASFCVDADVPAVYRRQAAPTPRPGASEVVTLNGVIKGPVAIRAARRSLKRAETGLRPGRHASLGLEAYAQATSPLRRYPDLTLHRQITSVLAGGQAQLDAEQVAEIATSTERSEATARKAERAANDYWLLRYLEGQVGQVVKAVVLEAHPRRVIQLTDSLREQTMPSLAGVEVGQEIRVKIERVAPRAGVLLLRRAD